MINTNTKNYALWGLLCERIGFGISLSWSYLILEWPSQKICSEMAQTKIIYFNGPFVVVLYLHGILGILLPKISAIVQQNNANY